VEFRGDITNVFATKKLDQIGERMGELSHHRSEVRKLVDEEELEVSL
jgi:hypothetical protein